MKNLGTSDRNDHRYVVSSETCGIGHNDLVFRAKQFTSGPEMPPTPTDSSPLRRLRSFFLRREEVPPDIPERSLQPKYRRHERTCLFASISARITASKALFTSIHWKLIESDSRMRDESSGKRNAGGEERVDEARDSEIPADIFHVRIVKGVTHLLCAIR